MTMSQFAGRLVIKSHFGQLFTVAITLQVACAQPGLSQTPTGATAVDANPSAQQPATSACKESGASASSTNITSDGAKLLLKPGQALSVGTDTEDIVATDDLDLARRQAAAYPDSAEASFILAVALTRTSRVEEAIRQVQHARRLADKEGGPAYFDKMIGTYEEMLKSYPDDTRVRYGLAWAYYMKAYLVAQHARKPSAPKSGPPANGSLSSWMEAAITGKPTNNLPHIQGALERADESAAPQIKKYYEASLSNLDQVLAQKPDDIWAKVYRAFLNSEYTGDVDQAMDTWRECQKQHPENPASYFFLGEAYLKKGNLKESVNNISRAIALRALGN